MFKSRNRGAQVRKLYKQLPASGKTSFWLARCLERPLDVEREPRRAGQNTCEPSLPRHTSSARCCYPRPHAAAARLVQKSEPKPKQRAPTKDIILRGCKYPRAKKISDEAHMRKATHLHLSEKKIATLEGARASTCAPS